jgi:PAS domain-containing protein
MPPLGIVPAVTVLSHCLLDLPPRRPAPAIQEFPLQRREEALHHGVVVAVPASAHAADDPAGREQALVVGAGVLAAPIRVMQRGGMMQGQGTPQRGARQRAIEPGTGGPADDSPRREIEQYREIEPALRGPAVRQVGRPDPLGPARRKLARQMIRRDGVVGGAPGGHPESAARQAAEPGGAHQARDPLPAHPLARFPKIAMNPRAAIGPMTPAMAGGDRDLELGIPPVSAAGRAPLPGVKARARDRELGAAIGAGTGGTGGAILGAAGGLGLCAPGGPAAAGCAIAGGVAGGSAGVAVGTAKGAIVGGAVGAAVDALILFAKKSDIKQVDQAIREALGRSPSDEERGDFRDYIHQEKEDGHGDFSYQDLVRLAKELFAKTEPK